MPTRRHCLSLAAAGCAVAAVPRRSADAATGRADRLIVVKSARRLYVLADGRELATYRVALGREPIGTKLYEGDGRTPEGDYRVDARNPASGFYRALRISYPNAVDRARAKALGQRAGGLVMIHGLPPERAGFGADQWKFDWTNGCIAVSNREMDELWARVEVGTPVEIRP
ncbi:MAG: L,D-transpeptidase family protein [Geminicoccaceae bacterium]